MLDLINSLMNDGIWNFDEFQSFAWFLLQIRGWTEYLGHRAIAFETALNDYRNMVDGAVSELQPVPGMLSTKLLP